jgi:CorA-like Mg2+ transporter protein
MENKVVRQFNHTLLWPVQLQTLRREAGGNVLLYWDNLKRNPAPWQYVEDALLIEDESCLVGYEEFVYFLPYVQRFLYGVGEEGRGAQSSLHIFKRDDVREIHVRLRPDDVPLVLDVMRLRLYFFYDIDVALVALEVAGKDIALDAAIELMDRLGRPYPPAWDVAKEGSPVQGAHSPLDVKFIGEDHAVLATSDYQDQGKFLDLVRGERQTPLASHWEYLLLPLKPAYRAGKAIKYYQLENKRIPIMTFLAFDDPRALSRGDMVRLGFAAKWGESNTLPYSKNFLANFESDNCYDRYWDPDDATSGMDTRFMFCGLAFAMITKTGAGSASLNRQFRHQFFQIGLIAHFHKAALLSMSNRFSRAVERLRVRDFESVKLFKRHVRETLEVFLRFNHRYWFHEISNQVQASDFFERWSHQLGSDALYAEVREEARDINEYLDADRARKQTDNTTRLTVVSACGMVGTIVTGFLGMNLYSHSDLQTQTKLLIFFAVFIPTVLLSLYTVMISRRVAAFMEALASEGLTWREKFTTFRQIWGADKRAAVRARRSADGFSSEAD